MKTFEIELDLIVSGKAKVRIHAETAQEALDELRRSMPSEWELADMDEFVDCARFDSDDDLDEFTENDLVEVSRAGSVN